MSFTLPPPRGHVWSLVLAGCLIAATAAGACSTSPSDEGSGAGGAGGAGGDAGSVVDAGGGGSGGVVGAPGSSGAPALDAGADTMDEPEPTPYVASASCPQQTPAAWQQFLETTVADPTWVKTCSDQSDCDTLQPFAAHVQKDVLDVFAQCAADVKDNPGIAKCTDALRRYAPTWMQQHGVGTYGFRQDNAAYFAAQTAPGAPDGMMTPPAALLAALPSDDAIVSVARERGWPYVIHDSGLGGVRTIVNVPDPEGRFDQWMVVGLDEGETLPPQSIMSFLAVQHTDAGGSPLARPRVYFRDYLLGPTTDGWAAALPESFDGKCYACHGSGVRLLVPFHGSVLRSQPVKGEAGYGAPPPADFAYARLLELNDRLRAYGPPDWNGTLVPADHGPPLGAEMGCTSCHDGVVRGPVTVSTSEGMIGEKVAQQVSMRASLHGEGVPDVDAMALADRETTGDPPLTDAEKAALTQARAAHLADYEAFMAARFPSWKSWALATPCQ